jgi:hypothetical protein
LHHDDTTSTTPESPVLSSGVAHELLWEGKAVALDVADGKILVSKWVAIGEKPIIPDFVVSVVSSW